jgi:predicted MPP superfamily phosphohydrolase
MWALLKILVAVMLYGTAVEPRFVVRHDEAAPIPHLPPEWEGKQVAVFADLQVGMWWANTDAARRLVRTVVHIRPAAVLIAGDFVYNADSDVDAQMQKVIAILRPMLDDSIPVYAVLGNHDYSLMNEHSDQENYVARAVRTELLRAGVHMMDNTVVALPPPPRDSSAPQPLYLAGIGEKWAKNDRVAPTLAMIPNDAPRLIFMHDPDSFALIPAGQAPIAIAAHTHGMQLGIPFLSDYLWRNYFSDAGAGVEGWISDFGQAGNRLYVNRGVGFSIVPARVNAVPELTVFTLKRAQ